MADPRWTPERVEALGALWREGLSAAEVARRLGGVTRNAVIGKLWRLGLCGGRPPSAPRPPRPPPRPRHAPARRPRAHPTLTVAQAAAWDPGPGLVADLLDLRPRCCRWPIGDPRRPGFAFCGRPARAGPYCGGHRRLAVAGPAGARG